MTGATSSSEAPRDEPSLALPTGRLLLVSWAVSAIVGGLWAAVAWMAGYGAPGAAPGLWSIAIVGVSMSAGVLVVAPWKPRPVSLWITFWMASTGLRMLVAPALAFLLYSAASLSATPLALAVAATYLLTLGVEVTVLSRHLYRTVPGLTQGNARSS